MSARPAMPNGRPGDHPLTDIIRHGLTVYGGEADDLIREIAALGGEPEMRREPGMWGSWSITPEAVARLRQLRDRLRAGPAADGGRTP